MSSTVQSSASTETSPDKQNQALTEMRLIVRRIEKTGASLSEHGPKLVRRKRGLIEPAQKPKRPIQLKQKIEAMEVVPNAKNPGPPMRSLDM